MSLNKHEVQFSFFELIYFSLLCNALQTHTDKDYKFSTYSGKMRDHQLAISVQSSQEWSSED